MKSSGKIALVTGLCMVGLSGLPLVAADGLLIVEKTTTGTKSDTNHMQIEKDRMRAETTGGNGDKQIVMFDATKQVIDIVNVDQKTYTEMTKADLDALSAQVAGAASQISDAMARMPPAQRAQIEAMMRGRGMGTPGAPAAPPAKTEYRKTGTDKVGKWTCDKYEGYLNNQKTTELCTVEPRALGLGATDLDITQQLAGFFKNMSPQARERVAMIGNPEVQGYSGFPVRRIAFSSNGQVETTKEIVEITHENFSASTYEIPAGFTKTAPMGGRGRGGARGGQ
jgi:hypothetical protein